ncbi:hypothetical protein NLG97_g7262 [Lecanicillium saksenae]|uniref:Uncharacterized protein n=1 Tax=Lecanicillium saksenae TaxID=468837 RepID=A0ACC1QME8_9HYPO|nr:hypothetical protein NLG97_g7262 [Lecanicillium saksenae]
MAPAALQPSTEDSGPDDWSARSERRRDEYVRSINVHDVCALASYYRNGKPCVEFREQKRGSYNVCYFLEFPEDHMRWVVRFPLTPILQDVRRKLDCEVATLEFIASRTSIPIPRVHAHGYAGAVTPSNPTGKYFIILDYISGDPLSRVLLSDTTNENRDRFYADLADFYSQMRGLEFDAAGALELGADCMFNIAAPVYMDVAAVEQRGNESETPFPATADFDSYTRQRYSLLLRRAADTVLEMDRGDVRYLVFALQDFEKRTQSLLSTCTSRKFVLTHGDLQPSNIILGDDFSIKGIIDWEWAGTVPTPFFVPPLWIGKHVAPISNDVDFRDSFSRIHRALALSGSGLATEWPEDMHSSANYFISAALLNQHFFMAVYYTHIFPLYYGDIKPHIKVREFFESDGPDGIYSRQVNNLMRASGRLGGL